MAADRYLTDEHVGLGKMARCSDVLGNDIRCNDKEHVGFSRTCRGPVNNLFKCCFGSRVYVAPCLWPGAAVVEVRIVLQAVSFHDVLVVGSWISMPPKESNPPEEKDGESSRYETVTEEEEAGPAVPKAAPKPAAKVAAVPARDPVESLDVPAGHVNPASDGPAVAAGPRADGPAVAMEAPRRTKAEPSRSPPPRPAREKRPPAASSPSVSEAPDRGRTRSRNGDRRRETSPPREAEPVGRPKGKGKRRVICDICWQQTSAHQSAIDQHRRWNLLCLSWQRFNRGGISWEGAKASAAKRKARRDAEAVEEMVKASPVLRPAQRASPTPSPERPVRSRREEAHVNKERRRRKEKVKKEVKAKSVRPSPSPEVDRRRRRRRPSSDSDNPGRGPDQAPQQLVITLPPGCKFG